MLLKTDTKETLQALRFLSATVGATADVQISANGFGVDVWGHQPSTGTVATVHLPNASANGEGRRPLALRWAITVLQSATDPQTEIVWSKPDIELRNGSDITYYDWTTVTMPDIDLADSGITVDRADFRQVMGEALPVLATDQHPVFSSVLISAEGDGSRFVATDTYRLSVVDTAIPWPFGQLLVDGIGLKKASVKLLGKQINIATTANGDHLWMSAGNRGIGARLIDVEYPRYRVWMPKEFDGTTVTFDPKRLLTLATVAAAARKKDPLPVTVSVSGQTVVGDVNTRNLKRSCDSNATVEGGDITVRFNSRFLRDALARWPGKATMEILPTDRPQPVRVSGPASDGYVLLMPIRVR